MGLILDSTELISAERSGVSVRQMLIRIPVEEDLAISMMSLAELNYGVRRADTEKRKTSRQRFLDDVVASIEILPITNTICLRAGELDAELELRGEKLSTTDLYIAATALIFDFGVLTKNVRHFTRIRGLRVVQSV